MREVDINEILTLLPHRYPFILIDKVLSYEPDVSLVGIKNVTINEPFFTGHFPEQPVMPGVLILEALAQASVVLANLSAEYNKTEKMMHFFAGIDNARFKQVVLPGDTLRLEVGGNRYKRGIRKMHGQAFVGDSLVCSADLTSAEKEMKK